MVLREQRIDGMERKGFLFVDSRKTYAFPIIDGLLH
jgi:hypothetical protein